MITLTREEAQQVLEWIEAQQVPRMIGAQKIIETLRAKVRRVEIWENRDLSKCECDRNEYCQHCWPLELRENKT